MFETRLTEKQWKETDEIKENFLFNKIKLNNTNPPSQKLFKIAAATPNIIDRVRSRHVDWTAMTDPSSWMHVIHLDCLLI